MTTIVAAWQADRMKRIAIVAVAALAACTTPIAPPPVNPGDIVDDECAGGGVAVGFPLRAGDYTVGQGNGGAFSHTGINQYGFDFTVDVGTDVIAARGGTVVFVIDGFGEGSADVSKAAEANIIVVDHGGGTFDSYFHLEAGSFAVGLGDTVQSGDLLAKSGNSGFTSAPHLHFAVVDAAMQSVPACFAPGDLVPATNDVVAAVASPLEDAASYPRSAWASDLFSSTNIAIDNDVEAFAIDGTVHIEGRVTDGKSIAIAFLAPFGGGDAINIVSAATDADGAFVLDYDASGFPGVRTFGLTSGEPEVRFNVGVLAPVVVK